MLTHPASVGALLAAVLAVAPQTGGRPAPRAGQNPQPMTPTRPAARPPVKLPAGVVARVDGRDITRAEVIGYLSDTGARKVVQDLIQRAIIENEAKKAGVTVTAAELAAKVKEEKEKLVSSMMQQGETLTFPEITRKYGLTEGEIAASARLNLLAQKTFRKQLEREAPSLDGQVKLAHILIATVPLAPTPDARPLTPDEQKKKDDEARTRIEGILADIRAGKVKFADAAKQFSDDKGSAVEGGNLPWFGKGMLDPAFEKAGFALEKPGDISAPVKSQFGWHIILLVRKGASATPAERKQFRDEQVQQQLAAPGQFQTWLQNITRRANITLNPSAPLFPVQR